jgi:hypothetical protein
MTTKAAPTLAERAAVAQAEANTLRAEAERVDAAGRDAANQAALSHHQHIATDRAYEYRGRRDELKNRLDELAVSDDLDLGEMFKAWVAMRDTDAEAGALNQHSSMLDTLQPPQPDPRTGAYAMPAGRAAVDELYSGRNGWTFTSFVDRVLAQRAERVRAQHVEQLRAEAHKEVSAAEQQARDAAAAGG